MARSSMPSGVFLGVFAAVALVILSATLFTVQQGQQGLLLRLGRLVDNNDTHRVKILEPGLHAKVPFIDTIHIFDARIHTLDIQSSRIVTKEKKDVMVDYYVKWRIEDLARYFKATSGLERKAQVLLEQQLNTALRAQFGKRTIAELVSGGRDDVMSLLRKHAQQQANGLGIEVVDVRLKGIELPPTTSYAIYQRMRADMQKIANRHRADGHAAAEGIQASADAEVTVLLARATSEGQMLRAHGEAEAASIYNAAFGQDKDFFLFYRSLLAYENSFSRGDVLVLDKQSAFFNYFNKPLNTHGG